MGGLGRGCFFGPIIWIGFLVYKEGYFHPFLGSKYIQCIQ